MKQGLFFVLEGVDGAGTTSQSRHLASSLQKLGKRAHVTAEPSQGPIGSLLRQILQRRLVVPARDGSRFPSWNTMALLFAADRLDHLESEIVPMLQEGITIICDRYYHSSVAYQSVTAVVSDQAAQWIDQINRYARRPDLTVVLDVSFAVAQQRRRMRHGRELYESDSLQQKLCDVYKNIEKYLASEAIVHIDAEASFNRVAQDLLERVSELYNR
ncbi:MAG: dTMP kinase [Deltaproteobacteria bacterium]|nr:dTMP kinase [Deltaproteobacteria bacterium]